MIRSPVDRMIRSPVGQDDSLSCGTGWFALLCSRMISSPVRLGWCVLHGDCVVGWLVLLWGHDWLSSPVEVSYPCSLGLMGSTSHLINEQGNDDRDHSSIDGRITVSTVLPMLGWPSLIWDQWYWSRTSGRSCTYYDADIGSVETGLGPVVHTLRLTSGQWRTGLGPVVGVVPTMTLTSGRLRLVWDQWYILWHWLQVSGGLVWDQWYALWDWLRVSGEWYETFLINSSS